MKNVIIMVGACMLYLASFSAMAQQKTQQKNQQGKTYNGDTTMHHKKSPAKSNGKNVPQNRNRSADSLDRNRNTNMENDQLNNGRDTSHLDTSHLEIK